MIATSFDRHRAARLLEHELARDPSSPGTTRGTDYDADAAMQAAIATVRVGACASFSPSFTLKQSQRSAGRLQHDRRGRRFSTPPRVRGVPSTVVTVPCPDQSALLRAESSSSTNGGIVGRAVSVLAWSNQ